MSTEEKQTRKGNRGFYHSKNKKENQNKQDVKTEEKKEEKPVKEEAPKPDANKNSNKGPPIPRHLATKQTPLKNDPAYLDCLIVDGDRGFTPTPRSKFFSPSCDSFMPLVHADYTNLVAANRSFGKVVSLSTYAYYNVMHLWARLFAIMRHRRELTPTEIDFLSRLEHEDTLPVTEPINAHLRCLGDFKDTNGMLHKMRVRKPNQRGDFERISAITHNYYESLPAPRIALERIRRDVAFTRGDSDDPFWEIPTIRPNNAVVARPVATDDATPAETEEDDDSTDVAQDEDDDGNTLPVNEGNQPPPVAGHVPNQREQTAVEPSSVTRRDMPTANLLGWYPAEKLSSNQLAPLRSMMAGSDFDVAISELQYVPDLMRHVANNLQQLSNYKIASALHESSFGSTCQEAFLNIVSNSEEFRRANYYCDGISYARCLSGLDVRSAGATRVFGLRIKKDTIDGLNSWACYDFGGYANVPQDWIANRNQIFATGLELQSYADQSTPIADRRQYRDQLLRAALVKTSRA